MASDTKRPVDVNVSGSRPLSSSSIIEIENCETTPKILPNEIESDSESDGDAEDEPKIVQDAQQSRTETDGTVDSDSGFESIADEEPQETDTSDTEEDIKDGAAEEPIESSENTEIIEPVDAMAATTNTDRLSKQEVTEKNAAGQEDPNREDSTKTGAETHIRAETEIETPTTEESEVGTPTMTHDSMVTVRLSEPPALKLDTEFDSGDTTSGHANDTSRRELIDSDGKKAVESASMPRISTATLSPADPNRSLQDELGQLDADGHDSDASEDLEEVNWEELEKTEDEQSKEDEADNSTALLLARLEQENAKLATNPKTAKVQAVERLLLSRPRPPSRAQLQQMVNEPTPSALRYSMLPPPPMTDLEFYAALVKDYQQTAARLPTLLSNKIRKGIPPPLRGVVWQSMSGARDASLEGQYDRFSGESSPYELLIGKDLGRSFPGVDMFREADGEGQKMLGRVLKCFSLYDTKIGYCQGLAFLVGPLLMHMPDKQAFCVLVRLMERYDLRACFLPDLSGLHVRIYQFRELLRQKLPALANHLEELQVETAYVSQWFLSFFAVTCPLPMLFRIYDVLFAEGASETLMRVALSLMRKNESRLLACTELEDVMQLLLSRGLWDCYHYDADEFVQDFASISGEVTREKLAQLEQAHRESLIATANAARASDVTTGATRFLGRIWASTSATKTAALSPGLSAPGKPFSSVLRRTPSKQSLTSTVNSMEASSASITSSTSTEGTSVSRDSTLNPEEELASRESTPVGPKASSTSKTTEDRYLHSQIEDLLTALSELQRNHALLVNQLQREREEREEDRCAVRSLLDGLRKKVGSAANEYEAIETASDKAEVAEEERTEGQETLDDATPLSDATEKPISMTIPDGPPTDSPSTEDLSELLDRVETRFALAKENKHRSSMMQTKSQLREELAQAKAESLTLSSQCQDLNRRVYDMDQEMTTLKEQLRERHGHVRTLHQDKQRLEKQIHTMKTRVSSSPSYDSSSREPEQDWANGKSAVAGLREFKLGRSKSTPSSQGNFGKRISSLPIPHDMDNESPMSEHDALLLELVEAKTAEASAKQEAEEAKQKLEALRKAYGLASGDSPTGVSAAASAMGGVFGRLTGQTTAPTADAVAKIPTSASASSVSAVGGFWGWRR